MGALVVIGCLVYVYELPDWLYFLGFGALIFDGSIVANMIINTAKKHSEEIESKLEYLEERLNGRFDNFDHSLESIQSAVGDKTPPEYRDY